MIISTEAMTAILAVGMCNGFDNCLDCKNYFDTVECPTESVTVDDRIRACHILFSKLCDPTVDGWTEEEFMRLLNDG